MYDNYDRWKMHERKQEEQLRRRPTCALCGEPVSTERFCHLPQLGYICEDCISDNMHDIEVIQEELICEG